MVRLKNRYLLVHILYPDAPNAKITTSKPPSSVPDVVQFHQPTPDALTPQLLARAIRDEVSLLFGDYGVGMTAGSLSVRYLSPATSTAIIKCSRAHYRLVWAALSFLSKLPKSSNKYGVQACVFQVVRVSGTIRKAEEEAIRRARATILKAKKETAERVGSGLDALLGEGDEEQRDPNESLGNSLGAESGVENNDDEEEDDSEEED
ncbi:MAG: hypothetical protein M1830_004111 [Pleopsidium flavum]|nr:MAG: hypothetical protein M1830_004111 [Pleopsidium flavum]